MSNRPGRSFLIVVLAFGMLSSLALADPVEDTALGEAAFNKEDVQTAMQFFTKAAQQNYAPAQLRLGELLDASEFDKEAAEWYRKAADQGNAAAEYHLGHMYVNGEGVERNTEKALYWFRRAAEKNDGFAVRSLAQAYRKGELGLTINLDQAKLYEDRANILEAAAKREAKKAADKTKKGAAK